MRIESLRIERVGEVLAICPGRGAEDVEPVGELGFLDVADEGIDARDRLLLAGLRGDLQIIHDLRRLRGVDDGIDEPVAAARVEPVGGGIFVEQALQPVQRLGHGAAAHGWRHMADSERADAPLGRGGLAWIV